MQARQFEQFLQRLSSLTRRQRDRLLELLQSAAGLDRVLEIVEQPGKALCCPHCQASKPYRHGHAHGLQRYRCRSCRRTFNLLSGTPLARLRYKAHWLDYLGCMLDSRSVRRSAREIGVASATSFRWRHRFLALSKDDRPQRLSGIAEADEMYVLESHKGSRSLDRPPRNAGERRRGALHIQNVNAYHSRMRAWLVPFRGIASRYLGHYFGWRWRWMASVLPVQMPFSERRWAGSTLSANSAFCFLRVTLRRATGDLRQSAETRLRRQRVRMGFLSAHCLPWAGCRKISPPAASWVLADVRGGPSAAITRVWDA